MLAELLLSLSLDPAAAPDPLAETLARVEGLTAYQLTLHGQGPEGEERLRYHYQDPGHIRLDMISPFAGAVLVYRPDTHRVQVWPFGTRGPRLSLRPDHRLVRSARGHRIDQSDVASLLRDVQRLQRHGRLEAPQEVVLDGQRLWYLLVEGTAPPGAVARYELWLDVDSLFPRRVVSRDADGGLLERVRLEDVVLDPVLDPGLFAP
ncbi:LolA family protein [Halomonas sp. H5]|uniref:LolA family protein n=1 Tax=Halomonas sp. H5 TaxID=3423910 RepID=UPI003D360EB2